MSVFKAPPLPSLHLELRPDSSPNPSPWISRAEHHGESLIAHAGCLLCRWLRGLAAGGLQLLTLAWLGTLGPGHFLVCCPPFFGLDPSVDWAVRGGQPQVPF